MTRGAAELLAVALLGLIGVCLLLAAAIYGENSRCARLSPGSQAYATYCGSTR
jgi:hypothetical protein